MTVGAAFCINALAIAIAARFSVESEFDPAEIIRADFEVGN